VPEGYRVNDDGSITIGDGLTIPSNEIEWRVTTSGGPGGQHANRSLTRVVASFHVADSLGLSQAEKDRAAEALGDVVRTSASRFRSQAQNRDAALHQLAQKLSTALATQPPRRATKPTKSSQTRRIDEKKARGKLKEARRVRDDG